MSLKNKIFFPKKTKCLCYNYLKNYSVPKHKGLIRSIFEKFLFLEKYVSVTHHNSQYNFRITEKDVTFCTYITHVL